jgi:hypothetical protein
MRGESLAQSDRTECAVFPINKNIVSGDIENGIEPFRDETREKIYYFLTYKPRTTQPQYHPMILSEANRNKEKNFYMVIPYYGDGRIGVKTCQ